MLEHTVLSMLLRDLLRKKEKQSRNQSPSLSHLTKILSYLSLFIILINIEISKK